MLKTPLCRNRPTWRMDFAQPTMFLEVQFVWNGRIRRAYISKNLWQRGQPELREDFPEARFVVEGGEARVNPQLGKNGVTF